MVSNPDSETRQAGDAIAPAAVGGDLIEKRRAYGPYTVFIVVFMCLGSATYGYAGSVIATTLGQPSFVKYMGLDTATNAKALTSAMVSLYYVGGIGGAFCHAWISNAYGRKASIIVGNIIVLVSGALTTGAVNPAMFIIFRSTTGWGAFQSLSSVPLWVSEIVPPRDRGRLVDIHAVLLNLGYTIAGYVGVGFFFYTGGNQWRGAMGLVMLFPAILLAGIYWMPESPRYLLSKGRVDEAWAIIHRLRSESIDANDEFAKREFYQMRKQIELDTTMKTSYVEIFRKPSYRKRAIITMYLFFSLISSGVLVINSYGALLYSELGYDSTSVLQLQAGWTACGLAMNIVAMAFADKIKRNRLIALGFGLCTATLIVEAALQKNYLTTTDNGGLGAAAAMLFLFFVFYSLTLDGSSYFYIGELWPSHLRAQGYTLGIAVLCITNVAWTEAAPYAFAAIGWKFYILFIVLSTLATVVAFFFFPNTLHKPLEEIALLFGDADDVFMVQRDLAASRFAFDLDESKDQAEDIETDVVKIVA